MPMKAATAFEKWFGASKVVGADGAPLVVYHGSKHSFTEFDRAALGGNFDNCVSRQGFYFTNDRSIANAYSWDREKNCAGNTINAYLSLQNPVYINGAAFGATANDYASLSKAIDDAKARGHDGAVIRNWKDGSGAMVQYVAFEPSQIKSALGNFGEFEAANNDIRFSLVDLDEEISTEAPCP